MESQPQVILLSGDGSGASLRGLPVPNERTLTSFYDYFHNSVVIYYSVKSLGTNETLKGTSKRWIQEVGITDAKS